ncbi:MAG: sulfite exporter TauE/SafE family protein [Desulforegulaceae bacterium]|nr:sulfite exporter TauE/SafE family protein [Desulforegulaceae bacterium]
MTSFLLYMALGSAAGFLAGLLGIGGGLIIVPVLTIMFTHFGLNEAYILHMALGTSLTSIIFTSISSMYAHHKKEAVFWSTVFKITPGILAGTFAGAWLASMLSTNFLKVFFSVFLFYVATQMILGIKPKPARTIPKAPGMFAAGGIIGVFSSLVGIGGGSLSVPFLTWCNVKMHKAIGTSAGIGFPIAIAGAAGYIITGLGIEGLPEYNLGFVNLEALLGIVIASMIFAPLGAKLAHSLPVDKLKKIFAGLLYLLAIRMLISLF